MTRKLRPKWVLLVLLGAAFIYLWVLPIFQPQGYYLWGHYQLRNIYLGIPVGLATLSVVIVTLSPARHRRRLTLRLTTLSLTIVVLVFGIDMVYTLGYLGAWRPNPYLDSELSYVPRAFNIHDDELGWRRKPRISWSGDCDGRYVYYRTDENGFRNPLGVRSADVVFIGDSFTEAAQVNVEDTFAHLVGVSSGLRVVNLGRSAYGPQQELMVLQKYGLSYNPRIVVWQITEKNDLIDAEFFKGWKNASARPLKDRYLSHSLLNGLLSRTIFYEPELEDPPAKLHYQNGETRALRLYTKYIPDQLAQQAVGFEETKQAIEAGYRLCQARGIQLIVVFVPVAVRVWAPYLTFDRAGDRERHLPGGLVEDERDFGSQLGKFCEQLGCSYVDAYKALRDRAAVNNRYIYIPIDEHLDVEGHKAVAEEVSKQIARQPANTQALK